MSIFSRKNQQHVFDVNVGTFYSAKFKKIVRAEPELQEQIRPISLKQKFFQKKLSR